MQKHDMRQKQDVHGDPQGFRPTRLGEDDSSVRYEWGGGSFGIYRSRLLASQKQQLDLVQHDMNQHTPTPTTNKNHKTIVGRFSSQLCMCFLVDPTGAVMSSHLVGQ